MDQWHRRRAREIVLGRSRARRRHVLAGAGLLFAGSLVVLVTQQHDVPGLTPLFREFVLSVLWLPATLGAVGLAAAASWYDDALAPAWAVAAAPMAAAGLTAAGVATVGEPPELLWRLAYTLVLCVGGCLLGSVGYALGRGVRAAGTPQNRKRLS